VETKPEETKPEETKPEETKPEETKKVPSPKQKPKADTAATAMVMAPYEVQF